MYHNHTTSTMAFRYSMLFMSYYPSVHLCTTYIMCYIIFLWVYLVNHSPTLPVLLAIRVSGKKHCGTNN